MHARVDFVELAGHFCRARQAGVRVFYSFCADSVPMDRLKEKLCSDTSRLLLLKVLSLSAGAFLIAAGIMGCTAPILGGGIVYTIGSAYAIIFGCIVMTVELKDKNRFITVFYNWLDTYLKFLTLQRGKGMFYLGVGILVFFMGTHPNEKNGGHWGINNVAALYLAIIGFMHAFYIIREQSAHLGPGVTPSIPAAGGLDFTAPIPAAGTRSQWNRMVDEQNSSL